jgi:hypothetical protein
MSHFEQLASIPLPTLCWGLTSSAQNIPFYKAKNRALTKPAEALRIGVPVPSEVFST